MVLGYTFPYGLRKAGHGIPVCNALVQGLEDDFALEILFKTQIFFQFIICKTVKDSHILLQGEV